VYVKEIQCRRPRCSGFPRRKSSTRNTSG
jgi:hypothetical protein